MCIIGHIIIGLPSSLFGLASNFFSDKNFLSFLKLNSRFLFPVSIINTKVTLTLNFTYFLPHSFNKNTQIIPIYRHLLTLTIPKTKATNTHSIPFHTLGNNLSLISAWIKVANT